MDIEKRHRGDEATTIRCFARHLQDLGVVILPEVLPEDSLVEQIIRRYTTHLLTERAVAQVTVDYYVPFARRFVDQRFGNRPLCLRALRESDVTEGARIF